MGGSLAQLPAAALAPAVESRLGPGSAKSLFLLAPFLAVLAADAAAARAAGLLGASRRACGWALLLAALGSPLAAYAASDFTEALQAAALGGLFVFALSSSADGAAGGEPARERRAAVAAGFCAGAALLLKSSLLLPAAFLLLPLVLPRGGSGRRLLAALAGSLLPAGAWLAFELARFGRPFASYGGESFSHPVWDGLWRLLAGPERGLLVFFPATVLAVAAVVSAAAAVAAARAPGTAAADRPRGEEGPGPSSRVALLATPLLAFLALLVPSAAWWAWHGAGGWGPRFLVPAVPLLAPLAALVLDRVPPAAARAFLGLSILLNLPPLLLHPAIVDVYVANCREPVPSERLLRTIPPLARHPAPGGPAGRFTVSPDNVLATVPSAAPHVVTPWLLRVSLTGDAADRARRLALPPWIEEAPQIVPRYLPVPPLLVDVLAPPPRLGFLGRSLLSPDAGPGASPAWTSALEDQVFRAFQLSRPETALHLATRLREVRPDGMSDALVLESLRLLGRGEEALRLFQGLPEERRTSPEVLLVRALFARATGDLGGAVQALAAAARSLPGTPAERAVTAGLPPAEWPSSLDALLRIDREGVVPGAPALGAVPP